MRIDDFRPDGNTWVLGIQRFDSAKFLVLSGKKTWRWTEDLLSATTFDTRELAEKALTCDTSLRAMLDETTDRADRLRLRALKVELRVGG